MSPTLCQEVDGFSEDGYKGSGRQLLLGIAVDLGFGFALPRRIATQ